MDIPTKIRKNFAMAIAALVLALAAGPPLLAQSAPGSTAPKNQPPFDPKDLSGQWSGGLGGGLHFTGQPPPLTPEAQAKFDTNTAEQKTTGVITIDPTFSCEPPGVPRIYDMGSSLVEFYQAKDRPDRMFVFYEVIHTWRTIWMNGRPMSDNGGVPRALGYSSGHWEGNDLVVDTTGFPDWGWVNRAGYPHSDALHLVERFHRIDRDHMRLDLTLNDPKAYAQPWKMFIDFTLKPDWDFAETFCRPSESAHFKGSGDLTGTDTGGAAPRK
jgi:hypothetical protein